MTKAEIIHIWQDLILKAGLIKKIGETDAKKFLKLLDTYESQLSKDSSKYAQVVLWFIHDIRGDIQEWREINIDAIENDDYIENYFITQHEVKIFNSLIDSESYELVFEELKKKPYSKTKVDAAIKKIDTQFRSQLKKLSCKNIAPNLLIFVTFDRNLPMPALHRLSRFLNQYDEFSTDMIIIDRLQRIYRDFVKKFYIECTDCIKKERINYKFLCYEKDTQTNTLKAHIHIQDASKIDYKSGNPRYEYAQLLKRMW